MALEHGDAVALLDGAEPKDLAHADYALPAEAGDEDLGARPGGGGGRGHQRPLASSAIFARTLAFIERNRLVNSGLLLEASCLIPVCHVKSLSLPSVLRPCVCS